MAAQMITRRGVPVRPRSRFEFYAWLFMRLSGLVLLLTAVFHILYMHFYIQVDAINFDVIALRWRQPFWRVYDFLLLAFGFSHGMNGARMVLEDYVPRGLPRNVGRGILFAMYLALLFMGAWIIFTFRSP